MLRNAKTDLVNWRHFSALRFLFSLSVVGILMLLAGCSGNQSALNPVADQAEDISHLWWLFCIVMTVIYLLVQIFFIWGISKRAPKDATPVLNSEPIREHKLAWSLAIFVAFTAIILLVFMIDDFSTGRHMRKLDNAQPLRILVTGHQWWWEIL